MLFIQISYSDTRPQLSERIKYPDLLRTVPSDFEFNPARLALLRHFGWTRLGSLYQDYGEPGRFTPPRRSEVRQSLSTRKGARHHDEGTDESDVGKVISIRGQIKGDLEENEGYGVSLGLNRIKTHIMPAEREDTLAVGPSGTNGGTGLSGTLVPDGHQPFSSSRHTMAS
ncbi:unnamed protein product [Protopolystoma xenopodis]|uniref:Receptor ligand binding region domain-containing protein n=1 Tax=Protopolystoma xenopodis TaxID=117903 RepID=A0A3S5ASG3_9PLAT|nr:unnamed protein product [Protopolystoma xenopodis]